MRHTHIQALMGGLEKEGSVSLPQHRKRLRAQLLATYDSHDVPHDSRHIRSFTTGRYLLHQGLSARRALSWSIVATFGVLSLGMSMPRSVTTENRVRQLVRAAAAKVERMSPDKLATIGREYEQIDLCLAKAMQSDSLHIATSREIDDLLPAGFKKTYPSAWIYVVYINEHRRRVVIALDIYNEPLFINDEEQT